MAPEQLFDQLSPRIDVWSLGCVMLQMITGKTPYQGVDHPSNLLSQMSPLAYAGIHFKEELEQNAMFRNNSEVLDFLN